MMTREELIKIENRMNEIRKELGVGMALIIERDDTGHALPEYQEAVREAVRRSGAQVVHTAEGEFAAAYLDDLVDVMTAVTTEELRLAVTAEDLRAVIGASGVDSRLVGRTALAVAKLLSKKGII